MEYPLHKDKKSKMTVQSCALSTAVLTCVLLAHNHI